MLLIDSNSKSRLVNILSNSFQDNPSVLSVIKKDEKSASRIRVLCDFCVDVSIIKKGAYLTHDGKGVALLFESKQKIGLWNTIRQYWKLGNYCIGWSRAWSIIQRNKLINSKRPIENHLYFWMLAVEDQQYGLETIKSIRDFVFQLSKDRKLSIFAETSTEKTLQLYLRYGFKVYNTMQFKDGVTLYFIFRPWNA
jgi:hypothetical protein